MADTHDPAPQTDTDSTEIDAVDEECPVVLVHGWGGSFRETWERSGFTALLADAGRSVIGVDLLGHGTAPKPHDPAAYGDLTERIRDALPEAGQVDAIGFSMGAMTLLRLAIDQPHRFRRLVLAGIGQNVFVHDAERHAAIVAALEGVDGADTDNVGRLFVQYASQPGNDIAALTAVLRRAESAP
ncbi:MAG TPA: alpha/beta fold hydrolase, partial [Ilumatobacteraceae bacterium]|nr:alpha/beta fold hydrolase [Ilumatobacteraceae bacterium]